MLEAILIGFVGSLLASAAWHFIARWLDRDRD